MCLQKKVEKLRDEMELTCPGKWTVFSVENPKMLLVL